ncbi:MAG TPA: hypothetical protein VF094_00395 [Gaiellaceae bacterium]
MGLKSFFSKWSKGEDEQAVERAEEETRMTAYERDLEQTGGYEGRKTDSMISNTFAGSEAIRSTGGEFDHDRI